MITYTEFKKQALFGFGEPDEYEFPEYGYNSGGLLEPDNDAPVGQWGQTGTRTWKPYSSDYAYDDKFETDRKNLYTDQMTAQQKWDTYQKQMHDVVEDDVGFFGGLVAKGHDLGNRIFGGGDENATNFDKKKDNALGTEASQRQTDMFLRSLTPEDINYYQKNKDKLTGGASELNKNLGGYQAYNKYVQNGMASQMWNAVKQYTFKYLPIAIGTFLRQVGANGLASFAENPVAFYGTLGSALFLGGASFLRGGGTTVNVNSEQKQNNGYNRIPYSVS